MKSKHTLEEGPSHLIESMIPFAEVPRFLPPEKVILVRLNVGKILEPVNKFGVKLVQLPDPFFQQYAEAHAVLTGYQGMERKDINDYKRFLVRIASDAVDANAAQRG